MIYIPQKRFSRASLNVNLSRDSRLFIAPTRSQSPHASIPMLYEPYICSIAYNGHARVVYITIPHHPSLSLGSKTHRIDPHSRKTRLPTRARQLAQHSRQSGATTFSVVCDGHSLPASTTPPNTQVMRSVSKSPAFYLDLRVPKFLLSLP